MFSLVAEVEIFSRQLASLSLGNNVSPDIHREMRRAFSRFTQKLDTYESLILEVRSGLSTLVHDPKDAPAEVNRIASTLLARCQAALNSEA